MIVHGLLVEKRGFNKIRVPGSNGLIYLSQESLGQRQKRLQCEARLALAQARPVARMQMKVGLLEFRFKLYRVGEKKTSTLYYCHNSANNLSIDFKLGVYSVLHVSDIICE